MIFFSHFPQMRPPSIGDISNQFCPQCLGFSMGFKISQLTFSGLAWKAMLMRFTVSLQQRYKNARNFKTYTSPAFYAKHVLKAGATKRYGLQT
jgi:hypothetical protein